jgi:hypothetical protein
MHFDRVLNIPVHTFFFIIYSKPSPKKGVDHFGRAEFSNAIRKNERRTKGQNKFFSNPVMVGNKKRRILC